MKVYIMGEMCFVDITEKGSNYMLCIGSKEEVDHADEKRVLEMVEQAVQWSRYRGIDSSKHWAIN